MTILDRLCPHEGRSRGAAMSCDRSASALYISLCQEGLRSTYSGTSLRNALACFPEDTPRRVVFRDVPDSDKEFFAVFHHELDHLRRQFSTSSGFLDLHLRSRLAASCRRLLSDRAAAGHLLPFPLLGPIARTAWLGDAAANTATLFDACKGLDSATATSVMALADAAAMKGLELGSAIQDRGLSDLSLFLISDETAFVPIGHAIPHIAPEIDEWLGAQHLYEHMAVTQEASLRCQLAGTMKGWEDLLRQDVRYRRVMNLWDHFFPAPFESRSAKLPRGDYITDVYRVYPVEFYAIMDLALWIPFTPAGFRSPQGAIRWEDVQPGHRFIRGMQFLKNSGSRLTSVTSPERDSRFTETQSLVAEGLGWLPVEQLSREWHEYFAKQSWLDDGLILGGPDCSAALVASTMLAQRAASPFNAVCNNGAWVSSPDLRFCLILNEEPEGHCGLRIMRDGPVGTAAQEEYFIHRGCAKLLFGKNGLIDRHDNATHRNIVNALAGMFTGDDFDTEYFLRMAVLAFG